MSFFLSLLALSKRLFGWLLDVLEALFKWMLADWRNGPLLIATAMWCAHMFLITPNLREQLQKAHIARDETLAAYEAEREAHRQTAKNYRAASEIAARRARANVRRVQSDQHAATKEIVDDYKVRLADMRAHAERLRQQQSAVTSSRHSSSAGAIDMPSDGSAASGADETTDEGQLPAPYTGREGSELNLEDAEICSAQGLQLDALIDWVEAQNAIDISPDQEAIDAVQ